MPSSRCRVPVHDTTINEGNIRHRVTLQETKKQNQHLEVHGVHEVDVHDVVDLARKDSSKTRNQKNDMTKTNMGVSTLAI